MILGATNAQALTTNSGNNVIIGNAITNTSTIDTHHNVLLGSGILLNSTNESTIIGTACGNLGFNGNSNILIGPTTGTSLNSGSFNVICGHQTGQALTTNDSCIAIGSNANCAAGASSSIALGANALATSSLEFVHASTVIRPNATNVCDIGLTGTRYKNAYFTGSINANQIITTVPPALQGISYISQLSDLPTPAGGFHTLVTNTKYIFLTSITVTNGFLFSAGCSIEGINNSVIITFNEAAADIVCIKGTDVNIIISDITFYNGGGHFASTTGKFFDCININPALNAQQQYGRIKTPHDQGDKRVN